MAREIKNRKDILIDLFIRIMNKKKWWLLPLFLVVLILSFFINIFNMRSVLPAIYTFF